MEATMKEFDDGKRTMVLSIKLSAEEKDSVMEFAEKNSINVSALVRKLLFEQIEQQKD